MKSRSYRRAGFSLIELLAVMVVIGILTLVTIPILTQVRKTSQETECASNLRQLHVYLMLDMQENGGAIPVAWDAEKGQAWLDSYAWLLKYRPEDTADGNPDILLCPTQSEQSPTANRTYGMNSRLTNSYWNPVAPTYFTLTYPERTIFLSDGVSYSTGYGGAISDSSIANLVPPHRERANAVFFDGHVESLSKEDFPTDSVSEPGSAASIFWNGR